ncbi:MAG: alpha/beta fold hydrolase [Longimicrobiales bacterium]
MDIPATLEGRSGHGVERCRGRSLFSTSDDNLTASQARLLELGGVAPGRHLTPVGDGCIHHLALGHGRPLVLLHGAGGGGANWYRMLGALSGNHRVLAPDLPGFGFSDPIEPQAPLGRSAARPIAAWLRAVVPDGCDIAATSFGGLITLRLAQEQPVPIGRIALIDTVGLGRELPLLVRLAGTRSGGALLMRRSTRSGIRAQLRLLMTSTRIALEHEDALVEYLYASSATERARRFPRALREFCGLRGQYELLTDDELRALHVPVLLAWGEHDRFLPLAHAQRAARLLPDARLAVIPGAGHSPNWERPGLLLDALRAFFAAGMDAA